MPLIQVLTTEQIKRQAQNAAAIHDDVNAACPYPFGSEAGQIFRDEFVWIRSVCVARVKAQADRAAQQ